ncbi:MAG TPA: beta-propeller fold lactonase family protein [Acidimicrobiales bacterium]|nr:beta-propeller fold lactonase family protein [Acidimicrobiales bacterium]
MTRTRLLRIAAAISLTAGVALVATGSLAGATPSTGMSTGHALFIETDQTANTVLAYQRANDGTLTFAGSYSTGGTGESAANAAVDPLASQGGLTLVDQNRDLIAVNPGSDTLSVFAVGGASLQLIQQVPSGGDFPDSVTSHGDLVAALNAGGLGAVAEFSWHGGVLTALPEAVRSLGLNNTTPPDFVHSPGDIGYSPNGRFLVLTTKQCTNTFGVANAYDVFRVGSDGSPSAAPTVTPAQNANPFAFTFDAIGHLVGAEASNSSISTYAINADGSLTSLGTVSDGQAALCWVTSARGVPYGSNAGSATVSSFTVSPQGVPSLLAQVAANTHHGTTDSAASPDGRFLYVGSGGSGALEVFAVNSDGSLSALQTLWSLPTPFEGIGAS